MKRLLLTALLLAAGCRTGDKAPGAQVLETGLQVGGLKGFNALETTIRTRLYGSYGGIFQLGKYLGSDEDDGLKTLLGGYAGIAGSSSLQNSAPNAVSMMLWRIVLTGAAADIAKQACAGEPFLDQHFQTTAKTLCTPETDVAARTVALKQLWLATMRYDAPKAEMDAWLTAVNAPGGAATGTIGAPGLSKLLASVFLDPYFLLAH